MPKTPNTATASNTEQATNAAPPASYEAALQELQTLTERMEQGDLPLDELLGSYQRGTQLLNFCRERLSVVEQQIKVLQDGSLSDIKV